MLFNTKGSKQFLYLAAHCAGDSIGLKVLRALSIRPFSAGAVVRALKDHKKRRHLRERPAVVYSSSGGPPPESACGMWFFDTVRLNHLAIQLRPSVINRLIQESGMTVVHCYLCDSRRINESNCLVQRNGLFEIHPLFLQSIEHISSCQTENQLVTLPFAELRRVLTDFWATSVTRTVRGWEVRRKNGTTGLAATSSLELCRTANKATGGDSPGCELRHASTYTEHQGTYQ